MKLPSFREAQIKAIALSLEATNAILPPPPCAYPISPLVATLAILNAVLDSKFMVPKDKEQVTKVGDYLAKWLATMAVLVDKACLQWWLYIILFYMVR